MGIVKLAASLIIAATLCSASFADTTNRYVGTWRMISATLERQGVESHAYGPNPHGWLVFTEELTFIEVLTDPRVAKFESSVRGEGTDEENRAAMSGSIGFFGRYTLDADGNFSGNKVEGSTFPNWVGSVRTKEDLQLTINGPRMTEHFTRPDGTKVHIIFERVKAAD